VKKSKLAIIAMFLFSLFGVGGIAVVAMAASDTLATVQAGRVIKLSVPGGTGEDIRIGLYKRPSAKGETVAEATGTGAYIDSLSTFYADAETVKDESDGSGWYKILLMPAHDLERRGVLAQLDKIPNFEYSYLYIHSSFLDSGKLKIEPLSPEENAELEYFQLGRPPLLMMGDGMAEIKERNTQYTTGQYRIVSTLKPIILHAEPVKEAETLTLPEGSSIVDYREMMPDGIGDGYVPKILAGYIDMEEKEWAPVVDGKALQVIGWAVPAALDAVLPAPFDAETLDGMNKAYPLFINGTGVHP